MKCIRPTYVREFQCDGTVCSSRCCKNWRVTIDDDTYQKFLALEDRNEILDKLEPLDENVFVVKLKDDGSCPFLDDDLLCRIQKRHGEECLSAICQSFPRVTYQLGNVLAQSLTPTCPLAARMILLSDESIAFETIELDRPRFCFDWTERIPSVDEVTELQFRSIEILQDRSLPIDRRLINLCRLLGDEKIADASFDLERHAEIMIEIFMKTYDAEMNSQKREQLKRIFIASRAEILERLQLDTLFENCLVNEFFMRCYPFAFRETRAMNCRIFVVGFKAVQFALMMTVISKRGRLSVNELLDMLDAFIERLDHHRGGMSAVIDAARSFADWNEFTALMLDI